MDCREEEKREDRYGSHKSPHPPSQLKLNNTCTLCIFLYSTECWAVTKMDLHKIDALDQWCLRKMLGIKWYVPPCVEWWCETENSEPDLSATVQARQLSLFGHIARMSDESDAKQILTASPLENWRRPLRSPVLRGWRLPSKTWNQWTSASTKQMTCLRIVHSGDWCLRLALRTHSGACQKWTNDTKKTSSICHWYHKYNYGTGLNIQTLVLYKCQQHS